MYTTVPGGVAVFISSVEMENACFQSAIVNDVKAWAAYNPIHG